VFLCSVVCFCVQCLVPCSVGKWRLLVGWPAIGWIACWHSLTLPENWLAGICTVLYCTVGYGASLDCRCRCPWRCTGGNHILRTPLCVPNKALPSASLAPLSTPCNTTLNTNTPPSLIIINWRLFRQHPFIRSLLFSLFQGTLSSIRASLLFFFLFCE